MLRILMGLSLALLVGCQFTGAVHRGQYDIDLRDVGIKDDSEATILR